MSKILAFIDGSLYGRSVTGLSAWAAHRLGCSVEIAHVLGRRAAGKFDLSGSLDVDARTALLKELAELDEQHGKLAQRKGRAILENARAELERLGIPNASTKLRNGDLLEALVDLESDAEIVVIGKRGEAADFAKLHLGSNLERVVRSAHKPILVAPRAYAPFHNFLIAYDGGRSANRAVEYVAASPLMRELKCTIFMVGADTPEHRSQLEEAASTLRSAGFEVEARLHAGEPDELIGTAVEEEGFGLLVMGAYGHSRLRNLVIGSTTTAMVRRCKVPVLMIR